MLPQRGVPQGAGTTADAPRAEATARPRTSAATPLRGPRAALAPRAWPAEIPRARTCAQAWPTLAGPPLGWKHGGSR
eukprot:5320343-Alexandrium_andersonii.AAC.1